MITTKQPPIFNTSAIQT